MSYFSTFIWDPLLAALARARGSSHPGTAAAGQAALSAVGKLAGDVQTTVSQGLTPNSAAALQTAALKDLEDGLKAVVDAFIGAVTPPGVSVLAIGGANLALDFVESHAKDYVSALFAHVREPASLGGPTSSHAG